MSAARLPQRLMALTTGEARNAHDVEALLQRIGRACEAGLPALLLREPLLSERLFLELAQRATSLVRTFGECWVGVHDRVHVALAAGADGIHLGFRSLPVEVVRELVGDDMAIGFSTHEGDDLAGCRGADYLFFGPVHDTPSKRDLKEPVGHDGFARAAARSARPLFALGGLGPADAAPLRAQGAAGVAAISTLLGSPDPGRATEAFLASWQRSEAGRSA